MARLRWRYGDRATPRHALVGRQGLAQLDVGHQQVERVLCVRFDQLELWECVLVGFDLVAVADFVEAIGRALLLTANGFHYFTLNAGIAPPFSMNVHLPSAHTRFSISIRFNWTYCSGDRPIACR